MKVLRVLPMQPPLLSYIAANDNTYTAIQSFTFHDLVNLNTNYIQTTINGYAIPTLIDLFLTHEKNYFVTLIFNSNTQAFTDAAALYSTNILLNALDATGNSAVIDAVYATLLNGPAPTTAIKITELVTFATPQQIAQELYAYSSAVLTALLSYSQSDLDNVLNSHYTPLSNIPAYLNSNGTASVHISMLDANDAVTARTILIAGVGYSTILNDLYTQHNIMLNNDICTYAQHLMGQGFVGWQGYRPEMLLKKIREDLSDVIADAVSTTVLNEELALVREYVQTETTIFGSARLGVRKMNKAIYTESFDGIIGTDEWNPYITNSADKVEAAVPKKTLYMKRVKSAMSSVTTWVTYWR